MVCGCERGVRNICSRFLKGDSCSLCGGKNTGAPCEKMVLMHFKSALDQQFLPWAHTSPRLQTQLLEVRGTEVSSWQTEASAETPYFALHYFNKPTALVWLVLGHRQGKTFSKQHKTLMTLITFSEIEPGMLVTCSSRSIKQSDVMQLLHCELSTSAIFPAFSGKTPWLG